MTDLQAKLQGAQDICRIAGAEALAYFKKGAALEVDAKGAQDWVSEADINVERLIREKLAAAWPDDGIVGEEEDPKPGTSGFDWVIDPIDGTTNFINSIPAWTIVLAGVAKGKTQVGVIYDPSADEMFAAAHGCGATLNGTAVHVANGKALADGTVAVGYSNRVEAMKMVALIEGLLAAGPMFHRNASGALSLAYVATGRLLGYVEEHMNAWDCLAGQLLIREAGGRTEDQDADEMIAQGGRVVAGSADVFDRLRAIADAAFNT